MFSLLNWKSFFYYILLLISIYKRFFFISWIICLKSKYFIFYNNHFLYFYWFASLCILKRINSFCLRKHLMFFTIMFFNVSILKSFADPLNKWIAKCFSLIYNLWKKMPDAHGYQVLLFRPLSPTLEWIRISRMPVVKQMDSRDC